MKTYDLLVIGGGINGAGIAAEAATRGLKVCLCEQEDLASKTSSASSKLIHGGLRYLENYEFSLVKKALKERETLLHIAPHLIEPLAFMLPLAIPKHKQWLIRAGLFLYDHLAFNSLPTTKTYKRLLQKSYFIPLKQDIQKAYCYFDAKTDDARLVITNALQAKKYHADILTYTKVKKIKRQGMHWQCLIENDEGEKELLTTAVINACGPWADTFNQNNQLTSPFHLTLVKGSHIVIPKLYPGQHAYILMNPKDGRVVFVLPYFDDFSLIGTTEVMIDSLDEKMKPSEKEITYLIQTVQSYFQAPLEKNSIIDSWSGIRPLLSTKTTNPKDMTRDYQIHLDNDGPPILSIFGGKITTYRQLAVDAINQLHRYFPNLKASKSHQLKLPGGEFDSLTTFIQKQRKKYPWLPPSIIERYARAYGSRMELLLKNCYCLTDLGENFGYGYFAKEIDYLVQYEWVKKFEDLSKRRTKLGLFLQKKELNSLQNYINQLLLQ